MPSRIVLLNLNLGFKMKENIEIMAGILGLVASVLKGIKKKFFTRVIFVNAIVGFVLSYLFFAASTIYLQKYISDTRLLLAMAYFIGWIANDFTDGLEKSINNVFDIIIAFFRVKMGVKKSDESTKDDTNENQ